MSNAAAGAPSESSWTLDLLDKALALPLTARHIGRIRRNHPDDTPLQVVGRLNNEFRAATIAAGSESVQPRRRQASAPG